MGACICWILHFGPNDHHYWSQSDSNLARNHVASLLEDGTGREGLRGYHLEKPELDPEVEDQGD